MKKMCIFETTVTTRLSVNTIADYIYHWKAYEQEILEMYDLEHNQQM